MLNSGLLVGSTDPVVLSGLHLIVAGYAKRIQWWLAKTCEFFSQAQVVLLRFGSTPRKTVLREVEIVGLIKPIRTILQLP